MTAGGAGQAEVVVDVALRALQAGVRAGQREARGRVVERGARPVGRRVAERAVLRESGSLVARRRGVVVLGLVAVEAGGAGEAVVVVDVALRALRGGMRAGEGEARRRMVERRAHPLGGVVAQRAVLREPRGFVRRRVGSVVIGEVAIDAGGAGEAVVVVDVALRALGRGMGAGEREARSGVVEFSAHPLRGVVAQGAILRESRGLVRRRIRPVVIVEMAGSTGRAGQAEIAVHVALRALHAGVRAGQRETSGRVVERRAGPLRGVVATRAILRESRGLVRRVSGSVVVGQVARDAGGAGQAEVIVHVALRALHAGVRAGQRETGRGVVEGRAGPLRGGVTAGAVLREPGGFVRRVGGPVEIRQVAV